MAASSATVTVPADGPNRITDVKTKVSETETVAGKEGNATVADPLTKVIPLALASSGEYTPMRDQRPTEKL